MEWDWAFVRDIMPTLIQGAIVTVQATTFPWHAASLGVTKRLGMQLIGSREHDTLGELLVFERKR